MYKIIHKDRVVDVVKQPRFFKLLPTGHVALTDKSSAHGIVGSNNTTLYAFTSLKQRKLDVVTIEEIAAEEFNRLKSLLNSSKEVFADDSILANAKRDKLTQLSNICKNKIVSGFSVALSDGETYSFKLTTEDQLNLMSIEGQLNMGAETFIYHATNQPCRFFSREDMLKIINTFKRYTLYHTTYFNVAKQSINSLTSLEKVNTFTYGTDVSGSADDIVIKQILKNGGNL